MRDAKRLVRKSFALAIAILFSAGLIVNFQSALISQKAAAKTTESAAAERVFFYAASDSGDDVLIKVIEMADLENISHGQLSEVTSGTDTGTNYYYSYTDNLPTTGYGEGKGFLLTELVDYVKSVSSVSGVSELTYSGDDRMLFMATDSQGSYNKEWTYNELYGETRYYFPDFYGVSGWNERWEISGTNSKGEAINIKGISLDEYNTNYRAGDTYSDVKDAVSAGGQAMPVILSPISYAGRTNASADTTNEVGISEYISANNGVATGSLADVVNTDAAKAYSLRLFIPQTKADLMCGHRTAYDNFKWIYNIKLVDTSLPNISSEGTVDAPTYSIQMSDNQKTAYITMSCGTPDASIYYSVDRGDALASAGAPQYLYTEPVAVDIDGRDPGDEPLKFYMTAVREGWSDNGIITASYPPIAPAFKTVYSSSVETDLVYQVSDNNSVWQSWTEGLSSIELRLPSSAQFTALSADDYAANADSGTLTIRGSVFADAGTYTIRIISSGFANKTLNVTITAAAPTAPAVQTDSEYYFDDLKTDGLKIRLGNANYSSGTSIAINGTNISNSYLVTNDGDILIKYNYFTSGNSKISVSGTYQITLNNSSYAPNSRVVSVVVAEGAAPSFVFAQNMTSGVDLTVGGNFDVELNLQASEEFTFYGGQYTMMYDAGKLKAVGITALDGWQCGEANDASGKGYLTFVRVGDGVRFGTDSKIAEISFETLSAGAAELTPLTCILTNASAAARGKVSGSPIRLTLGGGSGLQGDVNGDGSVTISDAVLLMQSLTGTIAASLPDGADVNGDGSVTIADAVLLMQILTGSD
ncbi:MAG: dockerin type I domain-containing protein [Oscillospiraceae bacterium]|nr:dockerin type I domain-containing protein [Oscillospiraceae bacterium]